MVFKPRVIISSLNLKGVIATKEFLELSRSRNANDSFLLETLTLSFSVIHAIRISDGVFLSFFFFLFFFVPLLFLAENYWVMGSAT